MAPRITVYLIAIVSFATFARAEERKLDSLKNSELIELLASKNPPPQMEDQERSGEIPHYPKAYDHEKQRVVLAVANELRRRGVEAFPDLIRAIDDQRFCCLKVGDAKGSRHLLSVGDMSWFIIETQVDACRHANIEYEEPQHSSVPYEKSDVKKWFESRKDWMLGQFQKESVRLKQKQVSAETFHSESHKKLILQQLDTMNRQLSQKGSYFELSGGFERVGNELLFAERRIKVTLKKK